jgi:transposase-like protein
MVELRWPDGVVKCPTCGSARVVYLAKSRRWKCYEKHSQAKFSLKTRTIFEDSPLPLAKWLPCAWLILNCKNGVSSWEIHRGLGVTQKTAWFMLSRLRLAMQNGSTVKLGGDGGEVEVDETYIGGKARNMHLSKRKRLGIVSGTTAAKVAVQGLLERRGEVRVRVVGNAGHEALRQGVREHVEPGTNVYTDEARAYRPLPEEGFAHQFVNHAQRYVDGKIHANGLENFWSLLKRGLNGTYVSVEPFHLFRYVDEQAFRYNNRKHEDGEIMTDGERFRIGLSQIVGRRLTYKQLTGKIESRPQVALG